MSTAVETSAAAPPAARLGELERVIDAGMKTFIDVGLALLEIRDKRLYRQTHSSFDDYCRERWGWGRTQAHNYIAAARVVENVQSIGQPPTTMSAAVVLASLPDEQQREVAASMDLSHARVVDVKRAAAAAKGKQTRKVKRHDELALTALAVLRTKYRETLRWQPVWDAFDAITGADVASPDDEIVIDKTLSILLPPHEPEVLARMKRSIDRFGVLVPIIVDQHGTLIDGHARYRIASELGIHCPRNVIDVKDHDEAVAIVLGVHERRVDELGAIQLVHGIVERHESRDPEPDTT